MRLICPNCDAQYEIPVDVMPEEGRDVQCSNCNHTWFQEHPDAPVETPSAALGSADATTWDPASDRVRAGVSAIQGTRAQRDDADPALPKRRSLDPSVADVLRAEAELEARARRKETGRIESQPELGLDSPSAPEPPRIGPAPSARMSLEEDILPDLPPPAAPLSRRDSLPDIEKINSTLRPNTERTPHTDPGQTAQVEVQEKRSTRRGFAVALLAVAAMTALYLYAPQVIQQVPETGTALTAYVDAVDQARAVVDAHAAQVLGWLNGTGATED